LTDGNSYRAGFVTIAGPSNVGKSTLLNRLVGQKVAIVTPKPQTTRRRIIGIRTDADAQLILIDTPGLHAPRGMLNRRMVDTARRCLAEGEVIVIVLDAAEGVREEDCAVLGEVTSFAHPVVVAINKIDLVWRGALLRVVERAHEVIPSAEIVPISAYTGDNVGEFLRVAKMMLPESAALMPAEQYTDQTERMISEELIREKIFLAMHQEIPFSTAVIVEQFSDEPVRKLSRISALVVVERETHKAMIIGAGGRMLKEIGTQARLELEQILGRHVFLELHVKVERGWTGDPRKLKELGL